MRSKAEQPGCLICGVSDMFAITLLIVSAVVGAGFATGAELMAFFGASALPPIAIAALVGVCLFVVMIALVFLQETTPSRPKRATPSLVKGNF